MLFARMERKNDHKSVILNPTNTRIFVYEPFLILFFILRIKVFRIYPCGLDDYVFKKS